MDHERSSSQHVKNGRQQAELDSPSDKGSKSPPAIERGIDPIDITVSQTNRALLLAICGDA
jgi:hypothetical protein